MREGIHPDYKPTTISCACGNVIETRATKSNIKIEVCSACHPFYTGTKSRIADKGGRIERFKRKYGLLEQE